MKFVHWYDKPLSRAISWTRCRLVFGSMLSDEDEEEEEEEENEETEALSPEEEKTADAYRHGGKPTGWWRSVESGQTVTDSSQPVLISCFSAE